MKKIAYLREHLSFDQSGIVMESDDKDGKTLHLKGIAIQGESVMLIKEFTP